MDSFVPSVHETALEINSTFDRKLSQDRLLVVLLGPSAVGKSTVIKRLIDKSIDRPFEYVVPFTTRPNRPGETDKVSVSDDVFDDMDKQGAFINVNELYGVRYGTPLEGVLGPLERNSIPITDFPLSRIDVLRRPEYDLLNFYVMPESVDSWKARNTQAGRGQDGRLESGTAELAMLQDLDFVHPAIDVRIVNKQGYSREAAHSILEVLKIAIS